MAKPPHIRTMLRKQEKERAKVAASKRTVVQAKTPKPSIGRIDPEFDMPYDPKRVKKIFKVARKQKIKPITGDLYMDTLHHELSIKERDRKQQEILNLVPLDKALTD